jgi:hypothetical protein
MVASASKWNPERTRENVRPLEPVNCEISPFHEADDACPWHGKTGVDVGRQRALEVVVKVTAKKTKDLDPDQILVATQSFATETRVVHRGERVRANDPIVGDGRWFVPEETPESERPNMWTEMESPPAPVPSPGFNVSVRSIEIPVHRRVVARESLWFQGSWAPGSIGEQRQRSGGGPPPPFGSSLVKGAIRDICDPIVRRHLEWFEWPARPVELADIERLGKEAT